MKQSEWNRDRAFTLEVIGMAVSVVGAIQYYVDMLLSVQGAFYGLREARKSLSLSRLGLGMCVVTFLACTIGLLRTAMARPE